ncbi:hypothetical protein Pfo_004514 [Paulownia fortunei]|nr:hypothetical protein Pfo_004514 [Paulownia fortunei]
MGNYRFRLSDMIPNAWFYKLKDMTWAKNHHKTTRPMMKKHASSSLSSTTSSLSSSSVAAPIHQFKISKQPSYPSDQRKSFYFTRNLTLHPNSPSKARISDKQFPAEPPRKSSRRRRRKSSTKTNRLPPRLVSSSVSAGCSFRPTLNSVWTNAPNCTPDEYQNSPFVQTPSSENHSILPEYGSDRGLNPETFEGNLSWSNSCKCRIKNDTVINVDNNKTFNGEFDRFCELDHLPPVMTKKQEPNKTRRVSAEFSERNACGSLSVKVVEDDFLSSTTWSSKVQHKTTTSPVRRFSANSPSQGVKLRMNSPRMADRLVQGRKSVSSNSSSGWRRSVSESFAVVKLSKDPRRDFWESMVEMIVENNIRASKDLEELLACYLSLNSYEYHDLIINVFKQIWFDTIHVPLK